MAEFAKTVVFAAASLPKLVDFTEHEACEPRAADLLMVAIGAMYMLQSSSPAPSRELTQNSRRRLSAHVVPISQCTAQRFEVLPMTLRIDRHALGKRVILHLIGNLRIEHFDELKAQIEPAGHEVFLDVGAVTRISVEGIRLLNSFEYAGVVIINASPYISDWMTLERRDGQYRK